MKNLKYTLISIAALIVGLGFYQGTRVEDYSLSKFGLSFLYPESYTLEERNLGKDGYVVTIYKPISEGALEGPPAINLSIHEGEGLTTPEDWVKRDASSNYNLALGEYLKTEVQGYDAISYKADGLYVSDNLVFFVGDDVFHLSVSYITEKDSIRDDFKSIITSMKFSSGQIIGVARLGPTCPRGERQDTPECQDKLYETALELVDFKSKQVLKKFSSKSDGSFVLSVAPGEYMIKNEICGKNGLIPVEPGQTTEVIVFCDTGIR